MATNSARVVCEPIQIAQGRRSNKFVQDINMGLLTKICSVSLSKLMTFRVKLNVLPLSCAYSTRLSTVPEVADLSGEKWSDVKPYSAVPNCPFNNSRIEALKFILTYAIKQKTHLYIDHMHKELGPIYSFIFSDYDILFVSDPHALETVLRNEGKYPSRVQVEVWNKVRDELGLSPGLVSGEGEYWNKLRKASEKPFLRVKDVAAFVPKLNEVSADLIDRIRSKRSSDGAVETFHDEVFLWSVESIGSILFHERLGCLSGEPSAEIQQLIKSVHNYFELTQKLTTFSYKTAKRFMPRAWKAFLESTDDIYSIGQKNIDRQRKAADELQEDVKGFLGYLLNQPHLDSDEIKAITAEMMGAGIDTTSNSLQWVVYEWSRNPHIQEELYQEVTRVAGPDQFLKFDDLQETQLLRAVVKESLRLYPTGSTVSRIIQKDLVLCGYQVPVGTTVASSLYTTGRLPEMFEDPDKFRPQRWFRENRSKQSYSERAFAALPFGFGSRGCIGRRVAELEMYLLIAQLVKNFRIVPNFTGDIGMKTQLVLMPEKPVAIKLIDRGI